MISWLKNLFSGGVSYRNLMEKGAIVIDVRSGPEYDRGHVRGALNIPFDRIATRIGEFRQKGKAVICCCESGIRSGKAVRILKNAGVEAYNGGNWQRLQQKIG
jgi:phage shock protein E